MFSDPEEKFEIIDESNRVIGLAKRSECHGNPKLLHRTVHVVVYHPDGRILLQKRSQSKDIQPGRWDTAVGGHLMPGESTEFAARREMEEELGINTDDLTLKYIFELKIRNSIESENVSVFSTVCEGPFKSAEDEIDELKFWTPADLKKLSEDSSPEFTPNLCVELKKLFKTNV